MIERCVLSVGGRHDRCFCPAPGGGYPDSCSVPAFGLRPDEAENFGAGAPDPRLSDLDAAGIAPGWRRIAQLIGFDQYLAIAGLFLVASPKAVDEHRVNLPTLVRYLRTAGAPYQFDLFGQSSGDSRQHDLRAAGVPHIWRTLARMIGIDRWFVVLGLAIASDVRAGPLQRISAPAALALYRIGRDALVHRLRTQGMEVTAIRSFVATALGESLTRMRIYQVLAHG